MPSKFWPKGGCQGILHHYTETLTTFEFTPNAAYKPHTVLFVGGLGDGLATTSYLHSLVGVLESTSWSLFSLNLTSSYQSWGLGSLDQDIVEISQCIRYIKDYKSCKYDLTNDNVSATSKTRRIVLMGHSTGSQDILHYLYRPNPSPEPSTSTMKEGEDEQPLAARSRIDGAIFQAPVSDREAMQLVLAQGFGERKPDQLRGLHDQAQALSREAVAQNSQAQTLLPLWLTGQLCYPADHPVSCRRFLSLKSPQSPSEPSEDDLFSSDLSDQVLGRTFGAVWERGLLEGKMLVLVSGADQSVPDWVDKEELMGRWKRAVDGDGRAIWDADNSGIIPNASHALSDDDQGGPRQELARRVLNFLKAIAD